MGVPISDTGSEGGRIAASQETTPLARLFANGAAENRTQKREPAVNSSVPELAAAQVTVRHPVPLLLFIRRNLGKVERLAYEHPTVRTDTHPLFSHALLSRLSCQKGASADKLQDKLQLLIYTIPPCFQFGYEQPNLAVARVRCIFQHTVCSKACRRL